MTTRPSPRTQPQKTTDRPGSSRCSAVRRPAPAGAAATAETRAPRRPPPASSRPGRPSCSNTPAHTAGREGERRSPPPASAAAAAVGYVLRWGLDCPTTGGRGSCSAASAPAAACACIWLSKTRVKHDRVHRWSSRMSKRARSSLLSVAGRGLKAGSSERCTRYARGAAPANPFKPASIHPGSRRPRSPLTRSCTFHDHRPLAGPTVDLAPLACLL